jgi:hypothetical protein
MVPGIVAGFYLSKYAIGIVDRRYIRKAVLGISFLAAILVIVKTLKFYIIHDFLVFYIIFAFKLDYNNENSMYFPRGP